MTNCRWLVIALTIPVLVVSTSACSSSTTPATAPTTTPTAASAAAATAASSAPAPARSAAAPSLSPTSGGGAALAGPCDLLTIDQIAAATTVTMPDGVESKDDARQIQMCTWTSTDPFTIVAASLTDVGAAEAYQTNVDLAPAYFDGDPVDTAVPGADKAYAVQQPDVGWVIGAIAKGRFLQIQVGGDGITEAQVGALMQDAVNRLPA